MSDYDSFSSPVQQSDPYAAFSSPAKAAQKNGQQPSVMQTIAASPVGRFAHDVIGQPIAGLASMLAKIDPTGGPVAPAAAKSEQGYQDAISAQQNRPGYAQARQDADAVSALHPSGPTDQFTAPFMPAVAGIAGLMTGGLNGMNAQADAQTAGQGAYQQANPKASTAAQLTGGLMALPEGLPQRLLLQAKTPIPSGVPSIAELKTAAGKAYDRVDNSGLTISAPAYDTMVGDLQAKLANEGVDKTLHPNTLAAYKRLDEAKGQTITFKGLDTMRKVAGDAIGAAGENAADRRMGYIVQNHIDDFVNGLTPNHIVSAAGNPNPTSAINDLMQARDLWSRASQASLIQKQIDKAGIKASANYSQSGMENALRQQFKSLALNDKAMSRLSPEVRAAVKAVAKGSPVANVLRAVGKYAPHGPVATGIGMGLGYMLGGLGGATEGGMASLAVPAAGEMARAGATRMTQAAAQRAMDTAALGNGRVPALPPRPLQIPQLTAQSAFPYGLIGSGSLLLRPQSQ